VKNLRLLVGAVASGLLFWAGFAPVELWISPIVAAILLFWLLAERSYTERVLISFFAGAAFFLPLLHWSSTYVGSFPWLILALGETLLFASISILPIKRNVLGVLVFAAGFTLIELLRMKFPFGGFGWGRLGFTQIESFAGLYPIVGVTGITFLLLLLSAISLDSIRMRSGILVILSVAFLYPVSQEQTPDTVKITAVQGGVDELGLDFNARALSVLQNHIDATPRDSKSDLIIWPENAVDIDPKTNLQARERMQDLFNEIDSALLVGVVEQFQGGPANSSIMYDADGNMLTRYTKQDLAPFGEYIPLRSIAERISPFAAQVRDFVPGSSWVSHSINGKNFTSFICFEILDDDHVRQGALDTDFLVAQTNNATFGKSSQAAQQLAMTRARAAELGRDFAVVSTTGFTAHLSRDGSIIERIEQFEPGALDMSIAIHDERTWASHLNSLIWAVFLGLIVAIGARLSVKSNR
jgi:apolipoprotein N-acyltransferase